MSAGSSAACATSPPGPTLPTTERSHRAPGAFAAVATLFFARGVTTWVVDPLVTAVERLSDVEARLSAFAFFIGCGVASPPAASLVARRDARSWAGRQPLP